MDQRAVPSGVRIRRLKERLRHSMSVIPAIYAGLAVVLSAVFGRWDQIDPMHTEWGISASSASTALAALGSGMIAFTGFVTSVVLMIIQFGSSQFSPRFLRWFRSEPTLKHAFGTFIATFLFALVATAFTGRGSASVVPYRSLIFALVLALASVGWFLALVSRTSNYLRVAQVTRRVDADARQVFATVYPLSHLQDDPAAVDAAAAIGDAEPVQILRHDDVGAILQSIDRRALLRLATLHDATIEMVRGAGDHVPTGGRVLRVYASSPIPERRLRAGLFFGDERTIEDDPAFSFRLLVDVAIKALSPAVNDPTTAVQCLDHIEGVLRVASERRLSVGVVMDGDTARLIYPTPSWDDLVRLALDEIRAFGATQYQISRRMRALLVDLLADLPSRRHPALERQLVLLDGAVANGFPDEDQRADALVADRQGLGPSRRLQANVDDSSSDPVGSVSGLG